MDRRKRLKYGSYAVLITAIVIGIFVLVTMIVSAQNWQVDVTKSRLYSLSDHTKQVLSDLEEEVRIYVFYLKGREDFSLNQMLDNYKKSSPHIKIEYLDVVKNPQKFEKYSDAVINQELPVSVVFETDKRVKVVNSYEMYDIDYQTQKQVFIGEQKLTNAIKHVTVGEVPTIYFLQGHKEPSIENMRGTPELLRMENYEIKSLNLLKEKTIPNDADIIVDVSPQTKFFPEEIKQLESYFEKGGKGAFLIDAPGKEKQDITALKDMLSKWGVEITDYTVVEGNKENYHQGQTWLLPEIESHEITDPIREYGMSILSINSRALKTADKNGYITKTILKSSSNSWGKTEAKIRNTVEKEEGDIDGPLTVAAAVTKKVEGEDGREMKVFVSGSSYLINDEVLQNGGNSELFLNLFGWLQETPEETAIRKQTLNSTLNMNDSQRVMTILAVLVILPGAVFISGLVVWIRRRYL